MWSKDAAAPLCQGLRLATARSEQPIPLRAILGHAMSENLDLVRSIYADWERGDYFSIRESKVTRLVLYWDPDRALAAAGLEG